MSKRFLTSILSLLLASSAIGSNFENKSCFPENKLSFPASTNKSNAGQERFQVELLINHFKSVMGPLVLKTMNKKLSIDLDWENPKVNASATRDDLNNPNILLFGGMVRHPLLTEDGLLGILCHELGHHLGGAPKKKRGASEKRSWSSAEGQADYFATNKCLPILFEHPLKSENLYKTVDKKEIDHAEIKCGNNQLCTRIALSGLSMAKVFASLKDYYQQPNFEENDFTQVWETQYGHPKPQCRLDTLLAGALCTVSPDIPFDPLDPNIGACYRNKEESDPALGERPRCWYNPVNF